MSAREVAARTRSALSRMDNGRNACREIICVRLRRGEIDLKLPSCEGCARIASRQLLHWRRRLLSKCALVRKAELGVTTIAGGVVLISSVNDIRNVVITLPSSYYLDEARAFRVWVACAYPRSGEVRKKALDLGIIPAARSQEAYDGE